MRFAKTTLRSAILGALLCCPAWSDSITYQVTLDTSSFSSPIGALGFLLTDLDGVANSEAEISNFSGAEAGLFSLKVGDVQGSLQDGLRMGDGQWLPLSSYFEFGLVFNGLISYTLTWDTTSTADLFTAVVADSPIAPLFTLGPSGVQSVSRIVTVSNGPAPTRVPEGTGVELPLLLVGLVFASCRSGLGSRM